MKGFLKRNPLAGGSGNRLPDPTASWTKKIPYLYFEFGRQLGKGRFGTVFFAQEKKTKDLLALKVVNKKVMWYEQIEKQLQREIEIHFHF